MQVQTSNSITGSNPPNTKPVSGGPLGVNPTITAPHNDALTTASLSNDAAMSLPTPPTAVASHPQVASVPSETDSAVKLGKTKANQPHAKKQIPTILGLLILFVALISGVLLFGQGTGVFAPRATPETTPKNIMVSNVTDKTFTISFYTDESTVAFIKYGDQEKTLDKQASDDRDQLSGVVKDYRLHHITVRGLDPNKEYYYVLGTGSSTFDNEGQAYKITTVAKQAQSPPNNQTVYGNVFHANQTPAEGAIVYVSGDNMGTLSSLVKSSGSWGIALSNAFDLSKNTYASLGDESLLNIKVQGIEPNLSNTLTTAISAAAPVVDLILGQDASTALPVNSKPSSDTDPDKAELLAGTESLMNDASSSSDAAASTTPVLLDSEEGDEGAGDIASSSSGNLQDLLASTPDVSESEVLDLNQIDDSQPASVTTVTTTQPQIKATLPANTMVRVVIHSDTQIDETLQTDADGNFTLDLAVLGQNLEPGEHTATYTYVDPVTGQEVTKTYNFTVDANAETRQLAAVISSTPTPTPTASIPYGSGNPYVPPVSSIFTNPTATPTATVTAAVSSKSATVSTASGQYNAGSVGTTIALLVGGIFFIFAGTWSYFLANSFKKNPRN